MQPQIKMAIYPFLITTRQVRNVALHIPYTPRVQKHIRDPHDAKKPSFIHSFLRAYNRTAHRN
jgi:hypothetical protein